MRLNSKPKWMAKAYGNKNIKNWMRIRWIRKREKSFGIKENDRKRAHACTHARTYSHWKGLGEKNVKSKAKAEAKEKTNTDLITSRNECMLNYAHSYVHKTVKGETTTRFDQFTCKQKNVQMCTRTTKWTNERTEWANGETKEWNMPYTYDTHCV